MTTNYRLTRDVALSGLPLSESAYKAHLDILREYAAGRQVSVSDDRDHQEAAMAIHQCGLLRDIAGGGPGTDFRWCKYVLTEYGRIYAQQRGIEVPVK